MSESKRPCLDCSRPAGGAHSPECPKRLRNDLGRVTSKLFKMRQRMGARRFDQYAERERLRLLIEAGERRRAAEVAAAVEKLMAERQGKAPTIVVVDDLAPAVS